MPEYRKCSGSTVLSCVTVLQMAMWSCLMTQLKGRLRFFASVSFYTGEMDVRMPRNKRWKKMEEK